MASLGEIIVDILAVNSIRRRPRVLHESRTRRICHKFSSLSLLTAELKYAVAELLHSPPSTTAQAAFEFRSNLSARGWPQLTFKTSASGALLVATTGS